MSLLARDIQRDHGKNGSPCKKWERCLTLILIFCLVNNNRTISVCPFSHAIYRGPWEKGSCGLTLISFLVNNSRTTSICPFSHAIYRGPWEKGSCGLTLISFLVNNSRTTSVCPFSHAIYRGGRSILCGSVLLMRISFLVNKSCTIFVWPFLHAIYSGVPQMSLLYCCGGFFSANDIYFVGSLPP